MDITNDNAIYVILKTISNVNHHKESLIYIFMILVHYRYNQSMELTKDRLLGASSKITCFIA